MPALATAEIDAARDRRDRSRTPALLAMLRDPAVDGERRREIEWALEVLDDERADEVLRVMVADHALPAHVRGSAAHVLENARSSRWPGDAEVGAAFRSGDPALRRIAMRNMTRQHEALLLPLLDDPAHPDHAAAIEALTFGFDHPRFTARCIRALAHPAAEVRRAGAGALLYTEPVAAVEPLLGALDDPDRSVAEEAIDTLAYMENRRALSGLATFADRTPHTELRDFASRAAHGVARDLAFALERPGGTDPFLREWLGPVWRWIEPALAEIANEAPLAPCPSPARSAVPACASVEAFRSHFSGVDRPWDDLDAELTLCDWSAVPAAVRDALAGELAAWPDTAVRCHAPMALHAWRDTARLLALLDDPCPDVAAGACWRLRDLGPDPRAAARVRARFDALPYGTRKGEALRSCVALAEPGEWVALVRSVLRDEDGDESLRVEAASTLRAPAGLALAREHIPLLAAPPAVRWDLHLTLLDAARAHGLDTPDLGHLREVDDGRIIGALLRLDDPR